jgi:phosphocarrier protein
MELGEKILNNQVFETVVKIGNADGLHMRPAMLFVDLASQYDSDIKVSSSDTEVDGKSIMQMSMLAATYGTELKIVSSGPDAQQAIDALKQLVEDRKFDEPGPDDKLT